MDIAAKMLKIATDLLQSRYGNAAGGVAVLRVDTGEFLTGVWIETPNAATELCAETGAICDAHKLNRTVTHSLCICRQSDDADWQILTPCGVCQERLFFWGGGVLCAVTTPDNSLVFKPLAELQPHYWRN